MSGQNWAYSDPATAAKNKPGEFRLADDETRAWDAYAAAVLSNLTDRTMGADVAAAFAATIADAMIIERRGRPRESARAIAPRTPAAEVTAATSSPAALPAPAPAPVAAPVVVVPVAPAPLPAPVAAPVATPTAPTGGAATAGAVCGCGHTTDTHVREAIGVDRWLRCVVPGCACQQFTQPAPVAPTGAAGL